MEQLKPADIEEVKHILKGSLRDKVHLNSQCFDIGATKMLKNN